MEDKTVNIETATAPDKKLLLRAAAWGFAAVIVRWAILAVGLFWYSTAMTNLCRILSVISGVGFGVAFVVFIVRRGRNISAWMLALLDVSGYVVGELAVRLLFPLLRLIPRDAPYDTFEVFLKTVLFLLPMLQIKFIGLLCVSISRHCEMKRQGGERVRGNGKLLAVIAACTAVAAVMCFFIHPLVNFENSDEEFLARSSSPDEAYTLDIYRHNGGATTAFTIKVYSVGRLSRKLIYNAYRESEAEVYWLSDSEVSINGRVLDMDAGETCTLRN